MECTMIISCMHVVAGMYPIRTQVARLLVQHVMQQHCQRVLQHIQQCANLQSTMPSLLSIFMPFVINAAVQPGERHPISKKQRCRLQPILHPVLKDGLNVEI